MDVFDGQKIIPAVKEMKDFERVLKREDAFFVVLEVHISQLARMKKAAREAHKKMIIHADLVQGLKSDRYAAEFLSQTIKPAGIISTRGDMLRIAKKNNIMAIQRMFLLDTIALHTSYQLAETVGPDVIELLPGIIPSYIRKVHEETEIDVIAGGLIETDNDVRQAIEGGARAVTTSRQDLWEAFRT
ncbi:glycerol-3-phosphate responsive antiterminator [Salicibibacter cibi]|uniref:Glycerol uptake operon antiterminator regulatory protein n=1 Tax=Salicibibacter cibi TaxID=2743001 RepID=A0A7T7CGF0_9BACI|nr:glycerol-3-phosphate responsive antiterminator [Salicibibacter cibi]QQK81079.1 glycerol-3-phosphate responsive antiterminator [Salicibibacter cibi]